MTKKRIGYAKFGRSMTMDVTKAGFQGDQEAPQLLQRLAHRNPDVTWVLVGRNRGAFNIPNVENPWKDAPPRPSFPATTKILPTDAFETHISDVISQLDGCVIHLGQHGTSHISLPFSNVSWDEAEKNPEKLFTKPLLWAQAYGRYITQGINAMNDRTDGRTPISWLCTDPRNFMKARDVKWPTGLNDILAQYQYTRPQRHERFRDLRTPDSLGYEQWCSPLKNNELWNAMHSYRYADLELMILPDNWNDLNYTSFNDREPIGVASTSFAVGPSKEPRRSELIRDIVLNEFPDTKVYGKWDTGSLADVPPNTVIQNNPTEFYSLLNRWRVSIALPALGSSWTVAKPYQLFAAGVVCFMYGRLDDQGWVLPSRRKTRDSHLVDEYGGKCLYSVRDDWTAQDIMLARWLRVETPEEFHARARSVAYDQELWTALTNIQYALLKRRKDANFLEQQIEKQLGL